MSQSVKLLDAFAFSADKRTEPVEIMGKPFSVQIITSAESTVILNAHIECTNDASVRSATSSSAGWETVSSLHIIDNNTYSFSIPSMPFRYARIFLDNLSGSCTVNAWLSVGGTC